MMKKNAKSPKKTPALTASAEKNDLQLMKINESRLEIFLHGLDNYEFQVKMHPPEFKQIIEGKTFFEHFYGVLKLFVSQDNNLGLGRILVLYGVGDTNSRCGPSSRNYLLTYS